MKVGIVTFFQDHNVGTCLQAYALQETLTTLGHNVDIINYVHDEIQSTSKKYEKIKHIFGIAMTYGNRKILYYKKFKESDRLTYKSFKKFQKNRYNLSGNQIDEYKKLVDMSMEYDAFVCGSDMIWAPKLNIDYRVYFLRFCARQKRVAYAPSFGTDEIDNIYKEKIKNYITDIPYLSCREINGVKLIKNKFGKDAQFVLDPTQLIPKEKWITKFNLSSRKDDKYVLCYLFPSDYNSWYNKIIKQAEGLYEANVRYIPIGRNQHYEDIMFGVQGYGPEEFLNLIMGAEFVITNSYHGFMFSLIFEKPFCILRRNKNLFWSQYEDRFDSILELINYKRAILDLNDNLPEELMNPNYYAINLELEKLRKSSLEFLNRSLFDIDSKGKK